jgi:SAM-dependent MidA family methyltransferase
MKANKNYNLGLYNALKREVSGKTTISIDKFMGVLQYNVDYGYYTNKNPIGRGQDFITAPEISNIFAEMLAVSIISHLRENIKQVEEADCIEIVEFGAGSGKLMQVIINCLKPYPEFSSRLKISILEVNPIFAEKQQKLLRKSHKNIAWLHTNGLQPSIKNYFNSNNYTIFLNNEFFDCLPIKQFIFSNNNWYERLIDLDLLEFVMAKEPILPNQYFPKKPKEGDIFEISNYTLQYIEDVALHIKDYGGMALIVDYGYFFLPKISTLQAVKNHKKVGIFEYLGESDLSALVNFLSIAERLDELDIKKYHIETQREFLLSMGIELRAEILEKNLGEEGRGALKQAIHRLTAREQMGDLFKVLRF